MTTFALDRLLILQAGHCFARFSDEVSIWVGNAGLDCVVIDRDGCQLSYVPQYAPQSRSNIRQRLQLLFTIRNQFHTVPIAFFNFVISDAGPYCRLVRWPQYPISSLCSYISKNESIVYSYCRNYSLRIVFGNLYLSFPIPISGGNGSVFIEQIWPIENCPSNWQHALNLAMQAGNKYESSGEVIIDMSIANSQSRLPRDLYQHSTSLISLPDHYPVIVEWMPDAVWHVVDKGRAVTATFAADRSTLHSKDLKFFEHLSPWSPSALYSVEHAGVMDFASSCLPIVSAMHRACRLLLHYRAQIMPTPKQAIRGDLSRSISNIKRHTCSVSSVGEFTCFEDGRVSVRFYDRTIVHLYPAQERLQIVDRDGTCVGVSLPCIDLRDDLIPYVRSSIEYANWANMSPEERVENERKARERDELVLKELHLCDAFLKNC